MVEEFIEDILADDPSVDPAKGETEINNNLDQPPAEKIETNSEETNNDVPPAKEDPSKKEPTIEELASQIGWNPDYQGEDQVDATTYILKSREIQDTMKTHNNDLKSQLSDLKGSVEALKDHNERVYRADVKKMQTEIAELKKQKRAAIETADVNKVDEIDKQIDDIKNDLSKPEAKNAQTDNLIFDSWVKDNQWYLTNDEMATFADTVAQQYRGAPAERIYSLVRQKVAEVFPEKFAASAKETPAEKGKPTGPTSPVESAKNKGSVATFTKTDLTPEQLNNMKQFVKLGVMTEEQYIKDIEKMQEG